MMGRVMQRGEQVGRFTIDKVLSRGSFANAYRAFSADGTPVFLKQYLLSPLETPWFEPWRVHQEELWTRVESSVRELTYQRLGFFLADKLHNVARMGTLALNPPGYFQAYEFVSGVRHIGAGLVGGDDEGTGLSLEERLRIARIFVLAIRRLHDADIIHTDLKPDNVVLRPDRSIAAGYKVQLVDLDWSLLAGRRPPWDAATGTWEMGVVGTDGWFSPEHLLGTTPIKASDIFTTGLILYQLLGAKHPYNRPGGYDRLGIMGYSASPPELNVPWLSDADQRRSAEAIHATLNPDPKARPTAAELFHSLKAMAPPPVKAVPKPPVAPPAPPTPKVAAAVARDAAVTEAKPIRLIGPDGTALESRTTLILNQPLLARLGEDAMHWDQVEQCRVECDADGWSVVPRSGPRNATTVNGLEVTSPTRLIPGDVIAVGNVAKGIFKLPLKVQ